MKVRYSAWPPCRSSYRGFGRTPRLIDGGHSTFLMERAYALDALGKKNRTWARDFLVRYSWVKVRSRRGEVDILGNGEMSATYLLHLHCLLSWSANYHQNILVTVWKTQEYYLQEIPCVRRSVTDWPSQSPLAARWSDSEPRTAT